MKFIILIVLIISSSIFAATIKGSVYEVKSNRKLNGAGIFLKSIDGKKIVATALTNPNGQFTLVTNDRFKDTDIQAGKYKLEIFMIGYMTINQTLNIKNQKAISVKAGLNPPAEFELTEVL